MLRFLAFACVVVAATAQSCGVSRAAEQLIVGGHEATPGAWPWQISLQKWNSHICGGSIIDAKTIITAAHCVSGRARNFKIVAGEHDRSSNTEALQIMAVDRYVKHGDYSSQTMSNDIAIMFLNKPLIFNDRVQPVCLPDSNAGDFAGAQATVTGWGETESSSQDNNKLHEVTVPVLTHTECNQAYVGEVDNTMICAGLEQGGKDSCQGDSGGPMVTKLQNQWHLIGVVSWGYGCADAGNPGVYSRVTTLRRWIDSQRSQYAKSKLNQTGQKGNGKGNNGNGNAYGKNKDV